MRLVQESLVLLVYGPPYPPLPSPNPTPNPAPHTYTPTHRAGFSETIIFGNLIHRPIEIRLFDFNSPMYNVPVVDESVRALFQNDRQNKSQIV